MLVSKSASLRVELEMDKSQKVASSVTFLIMSQNLTDLISQGIQIKIKNFLISFEPTNPFLKKLPWVLTGIVLNR